MKLNSIYIVYIYIEEEGKQREGNQKVTPRKCRVSRTKFCATSST